MGVKKGEIVFDENGKVVEVNGYDGGRKNFKFIELSEYYQTVDHCQHLINKMNLQQTIDKHELIELRQTLRKLV